MANLNGFDASQVAPAVALEAVPAGWYVGHMTASEMKPTANGAGAYLEAEFTLLFPQEYAGRKVFDRMNLQNSNPVAVEIAYKTLSAICHSVNVIQCPDSVMLHNRPLQIKVALRPAGPGADGVHREASNEVKGYKSVDGMTAAAPVAPAYVPPPVAAPAAAPVAAAPVWTPPPVAAAPAAAAPAPAWTPPAQPVAAVAAAPAPAWTPPAQPVAAAVAAPVAAVAPAGAPVPPWMQKPAG